MSQKSMPDLNLHLQPKYPLHLNDLVLSDAPILRHLNVLHVAQKKALICVLCNIAKYGQDKILFIKRNQSNYPAQYNPSLLGNKPLRAVIDQLRKAKLVKVTNGIPRYLKNEEDNFLDAKKSMFEATADLVSFCRANIRTTSESARNYVELKSKAGNLLEFEPTPYTDHINQLMKRYCEYLNRQTITVDDESIGDIFMARKYKDWRGDGSFQFGGRTHHPYMSFSQAKRSRVLATNNNPVPRYIPLHDFC
jgi:hypothetical protein